MNFYETEILNKSGEYESSEQYKDKVVLIVNTASNCGLTKQFEELEQLYKKYKDDGLEIIGIPSNSFKQESNNSNEAEQFCKLNYGVTFKMMHIVNVNGKDQAPIFEFLKSKTKILIFKTPIKWNFEKFLINKSGTKVKRFNSATKPSKLEKDIRILLGLDD